MTKFQEIALKRIADLTVELSEKTTNQLKFIGITFSSIDKNPQEVMVSRISGNIETRDEVIQSLLSILYTLEEQRRKDGGWGSP